MLNKVKIIGEVLPLEIKESVGQKINDPHDVSEEEADSFNNSSSKSGWRKDNRDSRFYFSLSVTNPNRSVTILRCVTQGENAERIKKEISSNDLIEIRGYLRNEKAGRQILIWIVEFTKLDKTFEQVDENSTNQVRLLGRINVDLQVRVNEKGSKVIPFHLVVPREGNELPRFFCRVQGDKLINEVSSKLKKNDIVLVEGFLQTVKIEEKERDSEYTGKISRISSIICQNFVLLDNDSVNSFNPFKQFSQIVGEVEKIDFAKPRGTEEKRE